MVKEHFLGKTGTLGILLCTQVNAFQSPCHASSLPVYSVLGEKLARSSQLSMALTPVGPFCPFRSSASETINSRMDQLHSSAPNFADDFARIQVELQMGADPDPDQMREVADGIEEAVSQWEDLMMRLRLSGDFQTIEYAKLTDAHLETHGVSSSTIQSMMRWQAGCMRAMADNTPPPMPPPDLDLQAMMAQATQSEESGAKTPSISAMQAAEAITANPFKPSDLESGPVKEEYKKLVLDHSNLIEFGGKYDEFDPVGKLSYLDEIEKIEERWVS